MRGHGTLASEPESVCNVHACDEKHGNTPIHWALSIGQKTKIAVLGCDKIPYDHLVTELLAAGADPFLENEARKDSPPTFEIASMQYYVCRFLNLACCLYESTID